MTLQDQLALPEAFRRERLFSRQLLSEAVGAGGYESVFLSAIIPGQKSGNAAGRVCVVGRGVFHRVRI